MAANPHRAEVELQIAGKTETMRATFDCLSRIENACGCGIIPLCNKLILKDFGFREISIIVTEGLRAGSLKDAVNYKTVGELVFNEGIFNFVKPCSDLLQAALGHSEGNAPAAKGKAD